MTVSFTEIEEGVSMSIRKEFGERKSGCGVEYWGSEWRDEENSVCVRSYSKGELRSKRGMVMVSDDDEEEAEEAEEVNDDEGLMGDMGDRGVACTDGIPKSP
jgi:hypothetical protein